MGWPRTGRQSLKIASVMLAYRINDNQYNQWIYYWQYWDRSGKGSQQMVTFSLAISGDHKASACGGASLPSNARHAVHSQGQCPRCEKQTQKKQQGQDTDKSSPVPAAVVYVNLGTGIKEDVIRGKIHFKAKCAGKTLPPVLSFFQNWGEWADWSFAYLT